MTPQSLEEFIASFFGTGNDLALDELARSNADLATWLDERLTALRTEPDGIHVLPRRHEGKTTWYGLAHSRRQLREFAGALQSFAVPSYARVDRTRVLDPADRVESAVLEFTDGYAFVLEVLPGQQDQVRRALELFSELQGSRTRRSVSLSRPLGRLLREFEMAVVAGSDEASAELLREIEASGQLSAQNLVFLRIRRLAGLRRFQDILELPELATVLSIRRPAKVSAGLLDAIYDSELAIFEAQNDAVGAAKQFNDVVLRRYPALFRSRHGIQTSGAIKSFVLYSVVAHPHDALGRAQLLDNPDLSPSERSFVEALVALVDPQTSSAPTLADAVEEARIGNYDGSLELARDLPSSFERAELLVRCAIEVDSIDAMEVARRAVDELDVAEREAITTSRWYATAWSTIRSTLNSGTHPASGPSTWLEWFQIAASAAPFDNSSSVAERAVVEWTSGALTTEDGVAISHLLNQDLGAISARRIKDALPHLLQFIDRVGHVGQHRGLVDDLSTLLFLDDDLGVTDVQVLVGLIGSLLEAGVSTSRTRDLVDDFSSLWARIDAPAHIDALIELLDLLLTFGSDRGSRDKVFYIVTAAVQRWRRRVGADQWALIEDLASELGAADSIAPMLPSADDDAEAVPGPDRQALRGKTIALYTLTEQAAVRARDFVLRHFDDVTVVISNDHVASDRLGSLARTADLFIVATRSAKHAATTYIESQRPSERPVRYAAGKGSASLIRSVFSYLAA